MGSESCESASTLGEIDLAATLESWLALSRFLVFSLARPVGSTPIVWSRLAAADTSGGFCGRCRWLAHASLFCCVRIASVRCLPLSFAVADVPGSSARVAGSIGSVTNRVGLYSGSTGGVFLPVFAWFSLPKCVT